MQLAAASDRPLHIVPMFNFGENELLDNVQAPMSWQRASVKKLRANVFFLPYGEYGLPGTPRKVRLTTAVAKPILVPRYWFLDVVLGCCLRVNVCRGVYVSVRLSPSFPLFILLLFHVDGCTQKDA